MPEDLRQLWLAEAPTAPDVLVPCPVCDSTPGHETVGRTRVICTTCYGKALVPFATASAWRKDHVRLATES